MYIENNIPNFLENINYKAKGSKSYIILSFVKKYFVLSIFLSIGQNSLISCIVISIAYFIHGIYICYFRFFKYRLITYYKIFQEFFIGITFVVIAISCSKLNSILEKSVISNDELYGLEKISLIVFFMLIFCLFLSLILFFIRLCISVSKLLIKIK